MAPGTRSKPAASKKKTDETAPDRANTKKLDASVPVPPQLFVLPEEASPTAHIVTLPDPVSGTSSRYLVCPDKGFFEFTRIAAPKHQQRSWLLAPERLLARTEDTDESLRAADKSDEDAGYVLQAPDVFLATPVDPLFLVLPSLAGDTNSIGHEYLAPSDYSARLGEASSHFRHMLHKDVNVPLHQIFEQRIAAVCDCMDVGDDKMYALSLPKLVRELVSKSKKMALRGLPASMEERFVKQALDVPVVSIKREESSLSIATEDLPADNSEADSAAQSQQSVTSSTSAGTISTAATSVAAIAMPQDTDTGKVLELMTLRVALDFLLNSYVSPSIRNALRPIVADSGQSGIDFAPLDTKLAHISQLKKDAQALRSLSDNISRKRNALEDDEDAIERAEAKKRKKEDEESRKKNVSHGVKKLMKADTSGMKKLSSFFSKPATKK